MKDPKNTKGFNTICAHDHHPYENPRPHINPIVASSSFEFDESQKAIEAFNDPARSMVYTRYGNPTVELPAQKIADLESHGLDIPAAGLLCNSGMSAITTLVGSLLKNGDTVLTQGNIYGGTTELLVKVFSDLGIKTRHVDFSDLEAVQASLRSDPSIALIYLESPSNPSLDCTDLKAITDIAHDHDIKTAIDNTFATPYLQQPFSYGIDYIIHSTTKYLNGHGTSLGGALICRSKEELFDRFWTRAKLLGTTASPFDAWLLNNGLKTLPLRMDRHCENAQKAAEFLEDSTKIKKVNYPGLKSHKHHDLARRQMKGFGGMLSFELHGDITETIQFMDALQMCSIAPTLGDIDTILLHPASSSHRNIDPELRRKNGITDSLVRMSVGIENIEDILQDLNQALESM